MEDSLCLKFSFGEVYRRIYGRKFRFTATSERSVKRDFRTYIRRYSSPNENFEYGYPHSNERLQFKLKLERYKPHKAARLPTKCDVINDVKLFPTVYRRIYCRKFLTLSNQTSLYKLICIRIYAMCSHTVERKATIRNRYNQVPHLTRSTTWESDKPKKIQHTREQSGHPFPSR